MVVPALLYVAHQRRRRGRARLGHRHGDRHRVRPRRCSRSSARGAAVAVRVFLLTLAIVDDIGAIVVIAVFYSAGIDLVALAVAVGVLVRDRPARATACASGAARRTSSPGSALWVAMYESGVHPTIAGVLLGLLIAGAPAAARATSSARRALTRSFRQAPTPELARSAMLERRRRRLAQRAAAGRCCTRGRATSIVPLFALANAGVALDGDVLERAPSARRSRSASSSASSLGKLVGIPLASLLAVRLGLGRAAARACERPQLARRRRARRHRLHRLAVRHRPGVRRPGAAEEAKVGVLAASVLAAAARRRRCSGSPRAATATRRPPRPVALDPPVDPRASTTSAGRDARR